MTDTQKAERLMAWIESVITIHGEEEAWRVWDACASREKRPAPPPPLTMPPKPIGWLK